MYLMCCCHLVVSVNVYHAIVVAVVLVRLPVCCCHSGVSVLVSHAVVVVVVVLVRLPVLYIIIAVLCSVMLLSLLLSLAAALRQQDHSQTRTIKNYSGDVF